jgi:hypothetical protein
LVAAAKGGNKKQSLKGGTYGSHERKISSNDAKRGNDSLASGLPFISGQYFESHF